MALLDRFKTRDAAPADLKPKTTVRDNREYVTVATKPGWVGYVYERWDFSPTLLDIMWIQCPADCKLPKKPSRFSDWMTEPYASVGVVEPEVKEVKKDSEYSFDADPF